jgi:hypothetical protein
MIVRRADCPAAIDMAADAEAEVGVLVQDFARVCSCRLVLEVSGQKIVVDEGPWTPAGRPLPWLLESGRALARNEYRRRARPTCSSSIRSPSVISAVGPVGPHVRAASVASCSTPCQTIIPMARREWTTPIPAVAAVRALIHPCWRDGAGASQSVATHEPKPDHASEPANS